MYKPVDQPIRGHVAPKRKEESVVEEVIDPADPYAKIRID